MMFCLSMSIASSGTIESFLDCCGDSSSSEEVSNNSVIESSLDCVGEDSLLVVVSLGLSSVRVGMN